MNFEIIVVGGGHAGCEAAIASAKLGHKTVLITSNINNIGDMPCNPSIGGSAKGIVVREIDALGGYMGKNADKAQIQLKMLNTKKGPAVRALRAQADKKIYSREMLKELENTKNLTLIDNMVDKLIIDNNKVKGVILENKEKVTSDIVILTTGTYMKADILLGSTRKREAPHGEKASENLSTHLKELGFKILRLKTGTPQRIDKNSIDYSKTKLEPGGDELYTFSFDIKPHYKIEDQVPCYLVYTTPKTHEIINKNISKSSMYGGLNDITGVGPRYCPSIEDKIVRFSDKNRHQLFIEPEGLDSDEVYLQGFSTSMPVEIQEEMVHSLLGFEKAIINKYGYAIEYDAIYPTQIWPSLETKIIENLFTAGQINGTSGYEEAAAQGLIAGINASNKLNKKEPLILKRNEAYIGVLIDDLVTKGTNEPYRLLTSRAEYRLLLRHDNADLRLRKHGYDSGLIDEKQYEKLLKKEKDIKELLDNLNKIEFKPKDVKEILIESNSAELKERITAYNLIKRPEISVKSLTKYLDKEYNKDIYDIVDVQIKYEGYIKKATKEANKMLSLDNKKIPEDIDYDSIHNIATEAKQKLKEVKPKTVGQATRISGVNPADISILMINLKRKEG